MNEKRRAIHLQLWISSVLHDLNSARRGLILPAVFRAGRSGLLRVLQGPGPRSRRTCLNQGQTQNSAEYIAAAPTE